MQRDKHESISGVCDNASARLSSADTTKGKPRLVHQYIWTDPAQLYLQEDNETATIKTSSIHVRYTKKLDTREFYKLSIEQWNYGSNEILKVMMGSVKLDQTSINGFIEYQKSINSFFRKYIGVSVLLYDQEYRELQHKDCFQWGCVKQRLQDFQLIPKQYKTTTQILQGNVSQSRQGTKRDNISRPRQRGPYAPDGLEICRKFNGVAVIFLFANSLMCGYLFFCRPCCRQSSKEVVGGIVDCTDPSSNHAESTGGLNLQA